MKHRIFIVNETDAEKLQTNTISPPPTNHNPPRSKPSPPILSLSLSCGNTHNEWVTATGNPHAATFWLRPPLRRGSLRDPHRRVTGMLLRLHRFLSAVTVAVVHGGGVDRRFHWARAQLRSWIRLSLKIPISLPRSWRKRRICYMDSQGNYI